MKTSKSIWARMMVLCLTLVMALSVATMGAFAAPITTADQTGKVTINGTAKDEGAAVSLYKIIDVNMVNANGTIQPQAPVYTWNDDVASWVASHYSAYIDTANDNAVTDDFSTASAQNLSAFYKALAEQVVAGTAAAKIDNLNDETKTVSGLDMGQYLVIATKTGVEYNPATVTLYPVWSDSDEAWVLNDAAVSLKSSGSIEKTVDKEDGNGNVDLAYAVGDVVPYRLDVVIPVYPDNATAKRFEVGDAMGQGLTFNGIETVKVYANTSATEYEDGDILPAVDVIYTVVPNEGNDGFQIIFDYDGLKNALADAEKEATYIHVTYTATVNKDAFTTDDLGNTAYVGVNTNPYDSSSYEITETKEKVYTYGIDVTKVDATTQAGLAGAEFTLKGADGKEIQFVETGDGVYVKYAAANYKPGETVNPVTTLVVASDGTLHLQGLDTGVYTLTETKAPGGYQLPADPKITITLEDTIGGTPAGADGELDGKTGATGTMLEGSTIVEGDTNVLSVKMNNEKPGFELPTTGGMGTVLFTAGGLVIMACGAALVLVTLKKKKAED